MLRWWKIKPIIGKDNAMNETDLFNNLNDANSWVKARYYVSGADLCINGHKKPNGHVHVEIEIEKDTDAETTTMMMAIARQVALLTHYPNFKEDNETTRTIVSIIYNGKCDSKRLAEQLKAHMGNLLDYCQFVIDGKEEKNQYRIFKDFMPLDIAFELREKDTDSCLCPKDDTDRHSITFLSSDVCKYFETNHAPKEIDILPAILVNMVYQTGADINNLPAYDNANIQRYSSALSVFCYHVKQKEAVKIWSKTGWENKLSCLCCADSIGVKLSSILDMDWENVASCLLRDEAALQNAIEENIDALALCEHSRWNVEKLIFGFRPFSAAERYEDEALFGDAKTNYRKSKKEKRIHIDLCSYRNLRRINPEDIKYDYFLMLAIPHILKCSL